MKRTLPVLTAVFTIFVIGGPVDIAGAQGRGAGARRGGPPATATPPPAQPPAPVTPPDVAGRGRPETAGRGRGEAATPPSQVAGRGRASGAEQEQAPAWARERRPPTAGELVAHNPQLAARLQKLLPGVDLQAASAGFSNLGQFVAAAHVSNNLGIPFDQVKAKMLKEGMNLGEAIQALRPTADVKAAAGGAEKQASADLSDVKQ